MRHIKEILRKLGLLDSEIETYLSALERGPQTVIDLAQNTGLSRQATYTAIETLTDRGLISSLLHGKRRLFVAEPPQKLLAYAKRKDREMHEQVTDLEGSLPELELRAGGARPTVRMYEGKEGLRALIEEMKASKVKEIVEITDLDALYKAMSENEMQDFRKEMRRLGLKKTRGIYSGMPAPKVNDVDRIHLPDDEGGFKADIGVFGDKIEMITFTGKMQSIIIESKHLAETLKRLFELAFAGAERKKLRKS
jgi:sugar-specific transcriptional regulator TrmB